jgi:very-short-patch-repair endonuclease
MARLRPQKAGGGVQTGCAGPLVYVRSSSGRKSESLPAIFRISPAEPLPGDKSPHRARICHVLTVDQTGELGLAILATAQRGVAHRRQIRALGFSSGSIAHRVHVGRLHRHLPSVFAVGHGALPFGGSEVAALLHAGDDAVLSHRRAASLWGWGQMSATRLELTVIGRHVRELPTLRAYRVSALDLRDLRILHGLPVTAPARTMIDFAAEASIDELIAALAEARVRRLVTDAELEAAMCRSPLRTGVARLRAVLADERGLGRQPTRNDAERRLLALIGQAGLPSPIANVRLLGMEVDLLWPIERVVVEFDGWAAHGHRAAFERDHRRGQLLSAAGYKVFRVTWRQLTEEPVAVVVRLAQTLAGG